MSKSLKAVQFDGTTFGMQIETSGAYRKFRNHIKPEKATSVTGSIVTILTVPAEWLGAIMGEAHWLVTEGKYFDTIRIDNGEKVYVKYDEKSIDFNTRQRKNYITNGGKIMSEVKDITEYTEEQTTIEGVPVGIDTALTPQMREAVKIHEAIIHHAAEAVTHLYEMGKQLKAMRDGKYYIHLGYESFGQYVEENGDYSFKERQAYKYIKIVETYSDKFVSDNQGLGIERLEMLTALGERDAAELVESTDLAGMTTAEVKQLIKEKQGLGEQLSLLESELDNSEAEYKSEIADAKKAAEDLKKKLDAEKKKLQEQKKAHDSEFVLLKEQRANAKKVAEDLKKKLDAEKKKLQEQKKAHDSEIVLLKEQLANAKPTDEQIEKIKSEAAAQVKAEYESKIKLAEDKMAVLEKKMQSKNENESRAALKVYFEETQKNVSAFIEKIRSLEDKTERDKYISGAVKWLEKIVEQLKGVDG